MSDPDDNRRRRRVLPPPLVALAGWIVPGAGYWLVGERARAVVVCVAIVVLYLLGLLVAGIRVIEVPGYGKHGYKLQLVARRDTRQVYVVDPQRPEEEASPGKDPIYDVPQGWLLKHRFPGELADKPWFAGQVLAGPLCLVSASLSNRAARADVPRPHAPLENIGTLYTAVAGMLNLFVIIDSTYRASRQAEEA